MQTLDRPILDVPDLSTPSCEQVITGNVPPDEDKERQLGGGGPGPEPLQGGGDPESEEEQGNEGAGT